jgi:hypothetical protein
MARATQKPLPISASDFQNMDRVQVIDREATPEETKKRIFYNHMRGLTGTVRRVYAEEEEVWVDVDLDSLPEEVRHRHRETEDQMRQKWLDGMSDEARRKLGGAEKQFSLRYSILTSPGHLILLERGAEASPSGDRPEAEAESSPRRKTLDDLTAAEQEFMERARAQRQPE